MQLPVNDLFYNVRSPVELSLEEELVSFRVFGVPTRVEFTTAAVEENNWLHVPTYINEFWTSGQRKANRLHEISYRACFKPQLPHFFIERLTQPRDRVYDPFMGRGTTLLEAALMGRAPLGCDVNPLSAILLEPRLHPPILPEISERLSSLDLSHSSEFPEELLVFYHPDTLLAICALKEYLLRRESEGRLDHVDRWIRMVAVNRLSGHSPGFFSVYTLPPNQAVSAERQKLINQKRGQVPLQRSVPQLILTKTRSLLKDCSQETMRSLEDTFSSRLLLSQPSSSTPQIPGNSVALVVTSPPFLDVVDYAGDNWLRCWFCGIDPKEVPMTILRKLEDWQAAMTAVFRELERILVPGGHVAFEVGEVRGGKLKLEEAAIPCGVEAGLKPKLVLINEQVFTKTANCWGVNNGAKGTNTNRIVVFRKPER